MTLHEPTQAPATDPELPADESLKVDERISLPESPHELLALFGSDAKEALRRKAFSALVRKGRRHPRLAATLITDLPADSPVAIRWAVAELYWGQLPVQPDPKTQIRLTLLLPPGAMDIASRVLRSVWVSRGTSGITTPVPERQPRLDYHPLLEVDATGTWPAAGLAVREDAPLFDGNTDEMLLHFAALDLPVARELVTRRGVLAVRRPKVDIDAVEPRILKATLKALEQKIGAIRDAMRSETIERETLEQLLALPRLAGRSGNLWGRLDRPRAQLAKEAPADPKRAGLWAAAMVAMPSTSTAVISILEGVPDVALMALLDAALAYELVGLTGIIQDIALARARGGQASVHLWQRLGAVAPGAPKLERWWRNIMAPLAPAGVVELDERTGAALFLTEIQSAGVAQLCDEQLALGVRRLGPTDRFRGTVRLLFRIQHEIASARDRAFAETGSSVSRARDRVSALQQSLKEAWGDVPPGVREAGIEAFRLLEAVTEELEAARAKVPVEPRRSITARQAPEFGDVLRSLYALERAQSEHEQAGSLGRMREHLAWAATEAPHLLDPVAAELSSLPPEALGAVLGVALSHRIPALLTAVALALPHARAIEVIWRATLTRQLPAVAEDARLPEALANTSAELLDTEINTAQTTLRDWVAGRPLQELHATRDQSLAGIRTALATMLARGETILQDF